MDIKQDAYGNITVVLSRRNLKTLLLKLDEPTSARTLHRLTDNGYLVVKAEADDVHYADRTAGAVHPREEEKL